LMVQGKNSGKGGKTAESEKWLGTILLLCQPIESLNRAKFLKREDGQNSVMEKKKKVPVEGMALFKKNSFISGKTSPKGEKKKVGGARCCGYPGKRIGEDSKKVSKEGGWERESRGTMKGKGWGLGKRGEATFHPERVEVGQRHIIRPRVKP